MHTSMEKSTNTTQLADNTSPRHLEYSDAQGKNEFDSLDAIAREGLSVLAEAVPALKKIKLLKLWKAGEYTSWKDYCQKSLKRS